MGRAGTCPSCGEPVSQFAAGCAICGADLEAHRRAAEERRGARKLPRAPAVSVPHVRVEDEWLLVGLTALLVLLAPLFGVVLAVLGTRNPKFANAPPWLIALCIVGVAMLFLPQVRFGLLQVVLG